MRRIYLDNSATTQMSDEVTSAMQPYNGEKFGNASSLYHAWQGICGSHRESPRAGGGRDRRGHERDHIHLRRHGVG